MSFEEKANEMIELYQTGSMQHEIATIFGCKQTTVSAILRKHGVAGKKENFNNTKYTDINASFFREINSEESAYFLGFLYADGCVQIKNNAYTTTLKLKSNDLCILEKLRDIMSPSSPILTADGGKYSIFRTNQKVVCEQLINLGCIPNKSLILEFPTKVPNDLIRHFLRGYSDGDGCIYANNLRKSAKRKPYTNYIWKFVSTKQFCQATAQLLKETLGINCSQSLSRPKTNSITTTLVVGGNSQSMKVLNWLYQDATIYLPRKYAKYLEFQAYMKEKNEA